MNDDCKNKVLHGDCLELMKNIPDSSVDMILCDPPYGSLKCAWDVVIPFEPLWEQYKRILTERGSIVLFATYQFGCDLVKYSNGWFKYDLVWDKNVPTGMSYAKYRPMMYHENILVFGQSTATYNPIKKERVGEKKECYNGYTHYCGNNNHINVKKVKKQYDPDYVNPSTVLRFNVVPNRNGKLHPTQKPVALCEYLIRTYTNEGETVLDNCAGSGTTGVACQNTGRNYILIEKERKYIDIIKTRLEDNARRVQQNTLF